MNAPDASTRWTSNFLEAAAAAPRLARIMERPWCWSGVVVASLLLSRIALAGTIEAQPDSAESDLPVRRALVEARRQLSAGEAAVVVELRAGRYELASPLVFGVEDSQLILRARKGEKAVLSGGRRVRGWQHSATNPALWQVTLPEVQAGRWYFRQLFVNGERAQRARTPNEGFFRAAGPLGTNSPIELTFKAGDLRPEWAGQRDGRLVILMKWTDLQVPLTRVVAGAGSANGLATLAGGPRPYWMDEPDARYWIENIPEALDAPGEWYLDRFTGVLSYLAPPGMDPNTAEIVAPQLTELIQVRGDTAKSAAVRGIRFEGLTLVEADYDMPEQGMISPQAAVSVPGAIRVEHAVNGGFINCTLQNFGGYGIELGRGAQGWRIVGNTVRSLGGGGVRIGEPGNTVPTAFDANHSHAITDNELTQLGRIFAPAVGLIVFHSGTNRIAHNHIADLYYTGISVGWNWGYQETPCRANLIEFNLVERVGQGRLSDMGGIYTLGPQPGTVIRNNVFREVTSYGYGGWGLYTDEGSTGILLENNVVSHCKSAGFHQHYGRDNVVRNNLIAFNTEHELMRTRSEGHRSFWFTNNVVIWDSGDLLGSNWAGTTNQFFMDNNVYFDLRLGTNAAAYRMAGETLAAWRARGQDLNSVIADPQLVDRARPELGLKRGSPAYQRGFKPIDLTGLGPRPEAQRD
jgi:parallel beta-helix repeat protein